MFMWNTGKMRAVVMAGLVSLSLAGCGAGNVFAAVQEAREARTKAAVTSEQVATNSNQGSATTGEPTVLGGTQGTATTGGNTQTNAAAVAGMSGDGALSTAEMFTERDLSQTADLADATTVTLQDDKEVSITSEGTYVLRGTAKKRDRHG